MNSTSSLIATALLLVVATVVIGCESDQKTNTALSPSLVTVGTVYANMTATATANSDQTTNLAPIPATPLPTPLPTNTAQPSPTVVIPATVYAAFSPISPTATKAARSLSPGFQKWFGYGVVGQDGEYLGEISLPGAEYRYSSICAVTIS